MSNHQAFPLGQFIVFEGADDLGKTTQIEKVYNYLLGEGRKVIKTREPGGTPIGSQLRTILLESGEKFPKETELLLFMADRNIHYDRVIKPYLEQGYTILCDRFHLSTLVYQQQLKGNDSYLVDLLHTVVVDSLKPDKTFIFHGKRLTDTKKDAYEVSLGDKSHEKLNKYYYEYGALTNHFLINANRPINVIFEELISLMG